MRSADLASDTAGKIGVIADLLNYEESRLGKKYEYVLDLDLTSPLRTISDLLKGFDLLKKSEEALNIFSVSKAHRNPYFNMVELNDLGFAQLVKSRRENTFSRQAAPIVYDMNASFYIYKSRFFELGYTTAITPKSLLFEMDHICFDLDEPLDFEFLSFLLENNKLPFELW
ncbi:CMP-N,N'-diacetyllegionaminic acid synthase [compost metagenome]